jgi:hypothetical protein
MPQHSTRIPITPAIFRRLERQWKRQLAVFSTHSHICAMPRPRALSAVELKLLYNTLRALFDADEARYEGKLVGAA